MNILFEPDLDQLTDEQLDRIFGTAVRYHFDGQQWHKVETNGVGQGKDSGQQSKRSHGHPDATAGHVAKGLK